MPSITVEHQYEIRRPVGEVYDFLVDHEHLPAWTKGVRRATRTSPGPLGVGTTYRVTATMVGRRIRSTYEITAYEPDTRFSGRMSSPILSFQETYRFEAGDDGQTVVRLEVEAEPLRWLRLLGPLLAVGMHRQIPADHRRLQTILERSRPAAAAKARPARSGARGRAASGGAPHEEGEPAHEGEAGKRDRGE